MPVRKNVNNLSAAQSGWRDAMLDRIRYVLLVWPHQGTTVADPEIVAPPEATTTERK